MIDTLADVGSVLELRRGFGSGMVTTLARIEGRPIGIVANDPIHLGGAIDSDGSDKAARFLQLCDAFDVPVLFLCDTPGMMVGPEVERTGLVRHCSRLFVVGANLTVPCFTIVLRKMYGLGGQAMAGGSTKAPMFTVAWPTGEFGGMGLEGFVKLGFRKELAAVEDPAGAPGSCSSEMVARAYEHGKAVNTASHFEIDDVIDPGGVTALDRSRRCAPCRHPARGRARSDRTSTPGEAQEEDTMTGTTRIRELAEQHWNGEGDLVHAHHPVTPVEAAGGRGDPGRGAVREEHRQHQRASTPATVW